MNWRRLIPPGEVAVFLVGVAVWYIFLWAILSMWNWI
jgi:hypothetical protein